VYIGRTLDADSQSNGEKLREDSERLFDKATVVRIILKRPVSSQIENMC
jgi:hypothetical protein